jgi:hypothetical protein
LLHFPATLSEHSFISYHIENHPASHYAKRTPRELLGRDSYQPFVIETSTGQPSGIPKKHVGYELLL